MFNKLQQSLRKISNDDGCFYYFMAEILLTWLLNAIISIFFFLIDEKNTNNLAC